jgi:class 3 adenylate cyclase/predicted ATPase
MLRSTLARWLMSAGYSVELAEGERRARQVLAHHRIALTILARGRSGALALNPDHNCGKWIVVSEPSQDTVQWGPSSPAADGSLSVSLDEQAVLTGVKAALQAQPAAPDQDRREPEILSFDCFTIDSAGRSLRDCSGSEVPLTRSEFALLLALARSPGRVLSRDRLLDAALGRQPEPYDRSIDVLIGRLRRKIEPDPKKPRLIVTVQGEGYKFTPKLRKNCLPLQPALAASEDEAQREQPQSIERRQLTVMSCGLVGSMALASRLDPEDLRTVIAEYRRCCMEVVGRFGGMVAMSPDDRLVAYFGYPNAHEQDAENALRAAVALVEAVKQLDMSIVPPLHVRIGIASGLVVAGGGVRDQPFATGEAPDLAAQLQAVAPPDAVMIGASTRHLVRGLFDYAEAGQVVPEGLVEPIPVWRVVGPSAVESRFAALRGEALTPLIGRDEELDLLLRRWRHIQSGEGRVVLISGEPGIGKSRLVRALQDRSANDTVVSFYCSPNHQDSPFYPVVTQLERAAGFRRDDTPEQRLAKFEAIIHPSIGNEARALITTLLSIPTDGRYPVADLSPQRRREKTLEGLVAQLAALASDGSTLVVFEDVHWMDPTSRQLLDLIVDRVRNLPVLLLITFRPEFAPPWASHAHATTVILNRLGHSQITAMADRITGKRLPREMYGHIVDHSDGVPLFVEELVKTVLESGLLSESDDEYLLRGPLPALAIPDTVQGLLLARLDRLGPAKEVAQTGAALGREFSYELISRVMDAMPQQALQEALQTLVQSELLYCRGAAPEAHYLFKHALLQDAAHETLTRRRRSELHAHIAAVLEVRFPEVADQQPGLLAHHYAEAGSIERAVFYCAKAGQRAAARSAMLEAEAQLRRGLQLLASLPPSSDRKRQELDLLVTLAAALRESKGHAHPEVAEMLGLARDLIVETEAAGSMLHFSVLYGLWVAQYLGGEPIAALGQAREFLSLAQSQAQSGLVLVGHRLLGSALIFTGDYPTGLSHLDRAVALYRPQEHAELAFRFGADIGITAQCVRAWALWHRGYADQARRAFEDGLNQARHSMHRHTLAYALIYKGLTTLSARWAAETEEAANELVSLTRDHGFALFLGYGLLLQAAAMILRGDGEAAQERIREGVTAMQTTGANRRESIVLGLLAEALALQGALAQGIGTLATALAASEASGAHWADAEFHRLRGELQSRLPSADWTEIEACFGTALEIAREQGSRGLELRAAVSLARLLRAQQRQDEAWELLRPVYGWFTEGFDTTDLKQAKALLDDLS